MALNRSDKSRILRRYSPGMTRNSEMSTEPSSLSSPLLRVSRGPSALEQNGAGFTASVFDSCPPIRSEQPR